jgi:hypothetical protein
MCVKYTLRESGTSPSSANDTKRTENVEIRFLKADARYLLQRLLNGNRESNNYPPLKQFDFANAFTSSGDVL